MNKMKVEIWSDVTCPFCYIGKRKFEIALSQFKEASKIEIIWRSFELAPNLKTDPDQNMHQFLAQLKGITVERAKTMSDQVANTAKQVGLFYNFDLAMPTNSFKAHQFSHLAKHKNVQNQAEESLFKAYFTEGKNIDDTTTLAQLGTDIGLEISEVNNAIGSRKYIDEVRQDILEATRLGIRAVPYFLFNGNLSVSGAQDSNSFLEVLEKAFGEWAKSEKSYQ